MPAKPKSDDMDLSKIQSLIKFVSKSGASEVELETKDFKIVIKTNSGDAPAPAQQTIIATPAPAAPAPAPAAAAPAPAAPAPAPAAEAPVAEGDDDSKYVQIKSPMIGTFYRSSSPDKPVFVNVGDTVKEGDVVCIVEAMKLFNEIESEVSGKIVKVMVEDSSPIEYDQVLFLVDPS